MLRPYGITTSGAAKFIRGKPPRQNAEAFCTFAAGFTPFIHVPTHLRHFSHARNIISCYPPYGNHGRWRGVVKRNVNGSKPPTSEHLVELRRVVKTYKTEAGDFVAL